jgi:hypothetical protein
MRVGRISPAIARSDEARSPRVKPRPPERATPPLYSALLGWVCRNAAFLPLHAPGSRLVPGRSSGWTVPVTARGRGPGGGVAGVTFPASTDHPWVPRCAALRRRIPVLGAQVIELPRVRLRSETWRTRPTQSRASPGRGRALLGKRKRPPRSGARRRVRFRAPKDASAPVGSAGGVFIAGVVAQESHRIGPFGRLSY